ncbi:hypothetical protein PG989_007767 [Apiospora arundinis]
MVARTVCSSPHKTDCKSPLGKASWQPAWVADNRQPAFIRGGRDEHFGANKYLWGNVPALDVLQLESNEGKEYEGELNLLFAASGDLRNVVQTIVDLPSTTNCPLKITINDRDLDIVARNLIILLTALVSQDIDETADCIIHIWYSALLRTSDLNLLQDKIRPFFEGVCEKIKDKAATCLLGKTWTFGERSLRVVLEKASWDKLLAYLEVPARLTPERACQVRAAITLADSRKDYRDRHMFLHSPPHRIAINQFRKDGLLLPFGSPRQAFQNPNPTFFQNADTWPMKDNADPLHGWPSKVALTFSGSATADIYGKLFYYLRALLQTFLGRLSSSNMSFQLFQVDVIDLPDHLSSETFSRIETPRANKHATLLTLFMNAVDETITDQDKLSEMTPNSPVTKLLLKYLPPKRSRTSPYDPEIVKFSLARDIISTYDRFFDRYMKEHEFDDFAALLGAAMKPKQTIIEKWPYRLKLRPGQTGAQEEFDSLITKGVTSKECYVEWKRTPHMLSAPYEFKRNLTTLKHTINSRECGSAAATELYRRREIILYQDLTRQHPSDMRTTDVLAVAAHIRHNELKKSIGASSKLTERIPGALADKAINCYCGTSIVASARQAQICAQLLVLPQVLEVELPGEKV